MKTTEKIFTQIQQKREQKWLYQDKTDIKSKTITRQRTLHMIKGLISFQEDKNNYKHIWTSQRLKYVSIVTELKY